MDTLLVHFVIVLLHLSYNTCSPFVLSLLSLVFLFNLLFNLLLSLSYRLVNQYLYNCFRECSGYTTVTG